MLGRNITKNIKIIYKRGIILLTIIIALAAIGYLVYINTFHMRTTINYKNSTADSTISNVQIIRKMADTINPEKEKYYTTKENSGGYKVRHVAMYGSYTYKFDIDVDGKIITPEITIMKTNNQEFYDVSIDLVVVPEIDSYTAEISVTVNGGHQSWKIEDIKNNKIAVQYGP